MTSTTAPVSSATPLGARRFVGALPTATIFLVLIGLLAWITILNPNFTEPTVFLNFLRRATPLMILAAGQLFVITAGGFDLSVGSLVTVTVAAAARWIDGADSRTYPIILVLLALGVLVGTINGAVVAWLKVPSFIVTLGMLLMLQGAVDYWTGGAPTGALSDRVRSFGRDAWEGVPLVDRLPFAIPIMLAVGVAAWVLLHRTSFGHQVMALGGGHRVARLAGVPVRRVRVSVFVISAVAAVIAGILLAGIGGVSAKTGEGLEFQAIAAVVLGGAALGGGRGSVVAALAGALTLESTFTLLNLLEWSEGMRSVVQGLVIVLAVAVAARQERRS